MNLVDFVRRELTEDDWMAEGACRGLSHLFFPIAAERPQTRERREEAEVRNSADSLVYQTEKLLRDQGDNVPSEEKDAIEQPLADLKKALEGADHDAIKLATETLMSASQAFSQKLYEAAAKDSGAAGSSASGQADGDAGATDDDIVDAEVVDED